MDSVACRVAAYGDEAYERCARVCREVVPSIVVMARIHQRATIDTRRVDKNSIIGNIKLFSLFFG